MQILFRRAAAKIIFGSFILTNCFNALAQSPSFEPNERTESTETASGCAGASEATISAELNRLRATLRLDSNGRLPPFTVMGKSVLPTYSEGTLTGFFIAGKRIQINTDSADGRLGNYLVIRDAKRNVIGVSAIDQTASNSAFALTQNSH